MYSSKAEEFHIENSIDYIRNSSHRTGYIIYSELRSNDSNSIQFNSLDSINRSLFPVEHSLSDGSVLHFVMKCDPGKDPFTELVKSNVPYLITSDDRISVWLAFLINLINVFATFVWNFLDIFIMIVSIGLSTHFKYLNNELEQTKFEVVNNFLMNEKIFIKTQQTKINLCRIWLKSFGQTYVPNIRSFVSWSQSLINESDT